MKRRGRSSSFLFGKGKELRKTRQVDGQKYGEVDGPFFSKYFTIEERPLNIR